MRILTIASGKGGVGKSTIAANLAILFGRKGAKVILADLDLGGSNLHLLLGLSMRRLKGLGSFLTQPKTRLEDFVCETDFPGVSFLPGEGRIPGLANIGAGQKKRLIRQLLKLKADYLIIDLGAGSNFNTVDFFLIAHRGILVTAPILPSILNAYVFLKNAVFRLIGSSFEPDSPAVLYLKGLVEKGDFLQKLSLPEILPRLKKKDPQGYKVFAKHFEAFRPGLVLNLLKNPSEAKKMDKLHYSLGKHMGVSPRYLGVLYKDPAQDKALESGLPVVLYKPKSILSEELEALTVSLEQSFAEAPAEKTESKETRFSRALSQAEKDFGLSKASLRELLDTGALTEGDLMEIIKVQQFEVDRLKKENQFLKYKLSQTKHSV